MERIGTALYQFVYDQEGRQVERKFLTHAYEAFLSENIEWNLEEQKDNPLHLKIQKSTGNQFLAISRVDEDTGAYFLSVTYKLLPSAPGLKRKVRKYFQEKRKAFQKIKKRLMKKAFRMAYRFYQKRAPRKGNILLFASGSREEIGGNEKMIYDRMVERGLDQNFDIRMDFKKSITVQRGVRKTLRFVRNLAMADIILIDDYYPEIYELDYDARVRILQVWHACGAFKTMGLERMGKPGAPAFNTRIHKCYTHVPVSSRHSALHFAEAFGIADSKFYPVGIPRTDIFFDETYKENAIRQLQTIYPQLNTTKKVYMYAPTFRGVNARDASFPFGKVDVNKLGEFCKKHGATCMIKMHPFITQRIYIPEEYRNVILDVTDYREINDLLFVVDVLITDYSSVIYEFSLLRRPMYFYAFDEKSYTGSRDFYEPYADTVPGPILHTFDELLLALEEERFDYSLLDGFIEKNFTYTDGRATDRVIDQLILGKTEDESKENAAKKQQGQI